MNFSRCLCDLRSLQRQALQPARRWRSPYKGKNIADVLDLTVEEAVTFFRAVPKIFDPLLTLAEVGLGYIRLGQQATTLSGGEAQRVKLATELCRKATGKTLYILDEPTTGLPFSRRGEAARSAFQTARSRQHPADHRAQSGRDQNGGLDH
ncbi:MAG: ATP-binding cassette domain-containing protein [Limisphaerales bacterium]